MVNKIVLQGRLVADPELRHTPSGVAVTSFRVAWSRKYKETETKLFLPCVAWRNMAEFVSRRFTKGQELAVEGQLVSRSYTDRDGNSRQIVELSVEQVHFCGPRRDEDGRGAEYDNGGFSDLPDDDGELPF